MSRCPYCDGPVVFVFISMSGGVWLSESKAIMEQLISGEVTLGSETGSQPIHCMIGGSGYRSGSWPIDGLLCKNCLTFIVKGLNVEE